MCGRPTVQNVIARIKICQIRVNPDLIFPLQQCYDLINVWLKSSRQELTCFESSNNFCARLKLVRAKKFQHSAVSDAFGRHSTHYKATHVAAQRRGVMASHSARNTWRQRASAMLPSLFPNSGKFRNALPCDWILRAFPHFGYATSLTRNNVFLT